MNEQKGTKEQRRREMVTAVRRGGSQRCVAQRYGVALSTVQFWVARAAGKRLDRVDWSDRPSIPAALPRRTEREIEDLVLQVRHELKERSDLVHPFVNSSTLDAGSLQRPVAHTTDYRAPRKGRKGG